MLLISKTWSENFGQNTGGGGDFVGALNVILEKKQILLCGLIASSFESSMFIFVFNWTPCLMEEGEPVPPFGHIFSCFMIMCMLGSRIFAYVSGFVSVEQIGVVVMMVSALCHIMIVLTSNVVIRFLAFLVFEACVGLYFPLMGTLKGDIVPEDMRSTIYNIYRLPLNVMVLLPLLMNFSISTTFIVTTAILINAMTCQFFLMNMRLTEAKSTKDGEPHDPSVPGEIEAMVIGDKAASEP